MQLLGHLILIHIGLKITIVTVKIQPEMVSL